MGDSSTHVNTIEILYAQGEIHTALVRSAPSSATCSSGVIIVNHDSRFFFLKKKARKNEAIYQQERDLFPHQKSLTATAFIFISFSFLFFSFSGRSKERFNCTFAISRRYLVTDKIERDSCRSAPPTVSERLRPHQAFHCHPASPVSHNSQQYHGAINRCFTTASVLEALRKKAPACTNTYAHLPLSPLSLTHTYTHTHTRARIYKMQGNSHSRRKAQPAARGRRQQRRQT